MSLFPNRVFILARTKIIIQSINNDDKNISEFSLVSQKNVPVFGAYDLNL